MSAVSGINNNSQANTGQTDTGVRTTGKQTLDVNDFLKLITVQLSNQDPLKPMEDTQFISQMANFSSLQQMQVLSKDFENFSSSATQMNAQNYLGKTVTIPADSGLDPSRIDIRIASASMMQTSRHPLGATESAAK